MTFGEFLTTSSYVVGAFVFWWAARQRKLGTEGMRYIALAGFVGGVFGAKLTEWVLMHPGVFAAHPLAILDPRWGGRTLIGGVLCGWLAVEITKWRLGIRRSTGDMFALALPAGEVLGRIGCHFNGCCFGVPSGMFCAVYQHDAWRQPTQLYSAFMAAVIFGVLLALREKMAREGDLFKCYLLLYGTSRFFIEFLRESDPAPGGLSVAQWVCLGMALAGGLALRSSLARSGKALPLAEEV